MPLAAGSNSAKLRATRPRPLRDYIGHGQHGLDPSPARARVSVDFHCFNLPAALQVIDRVRPKVYGSYSENVQELAFDRRVYKRGRRVKPALCDCPESRRSSRRWGCDRSAFWALAETPYLPYENHLQRTRVPYSIGLHRAYALTAINHWSDPYGKAEPIADGLRNLWSISASKLRRDCMISAPPSKSNWST